jgi:cellulose synthase/poly-beta-1,6-N-acetylglucosamine synthase-like glycosyltransferase
MTPPFRCAIAILARNEAALLPRCLDALANQTVGAGVFFTVVLANNCTDDTAACARRFDRLPHRRVAEVDFAKGIDHAGSARRAAMDIAATYAEIILTTDADCVPDLDWVEAMLAAFARNVDAVAGAVSGDWNELRHMPPDALAVGKIEWEYLAVLAAAEAKFDPQPHDPMPRHAQCCGANIGITRAMLAAVGGVPAIATGEDRALIKAVRRMGGKVRHDPRPHVVASARTIGRASGGMADALTSRTSAEYLCDEQFESAENVIARLKRQHAARCSGQKNSMSDEPPHRLTPAQLKKELEKLRVLIGEDDDQ